MTQHWRARVKAAQAEFESVERPAKQFRRKIPNSVMDDQRLGLAELALLLIDAAQRDGFVIHWKVVRERIEMGRDLYHEASKGLQAAGYLHRRQAHIGERAIHRLTLAAAEGRQGYFLNTVSCDGLGWREYALASWMASHAWGLPIYTSRIMRRFQISIATAERLIKKLRDKRIVIKSQRRDSETGQFFGHGWVFDLTAAVAYSEAFSHSIKNRTRRSRTRKSRTHNTNEPSITATPNEPPITSSNEGHYTSPIGEPPRPSQERGQGEYARRKETKARRKEAKRAAAVAPERCSDTSLFSGHDVADNLISIYFEDSAEYVDLSSVPDEQLAESIRRATENRIGRHLLTAEGLDSARQIIVGIMFGENLSPDVVGFHEAYEIFWQAVWDRIGSQQGQWLNHWNLIAHRLAARMYCEGDLTLTYEGESLLQYLRDRDGALMLSPELFSPSGLHQLRSFLRQYDAETAVPVICGVLSRGMIGGTHQDGCITSWRYFEGSIREEMEAIFRQFNGEGVRFR